MGVKVKGADPNACAELNMLNEDPRIWNPWDVSAPPPRGLGTTPTSMPAQFQPDPAPDLHLDHSLGSWLTKLPSARHAFERKTPEGRIN
jgi:hypothetical protein